MSIVAKKAPQREQVPAGSHVARCIKIIHFGTAIESNHLGERVQRNTVRLTWEIPGEMRTFDEEQGPQPMSISKDYTLSLHEKANLRADLEGWRGQGFTPDELEGFDILNVQGQPCMLSIIHVPSKKTGNIYARIVGVRDYPRILYALKTLILCSCGTMIRTMMRGSWLTYMSGSGKRSKPVMSIKLKLTLLMRRV